MSNRTFYASTYVVADGVTRTWPFSFAGVNTGQESGTAPYLYPEDVKVQEMYTDAAGNKQTVQRTGVLSAPNQMTIDGPAVLAGREIRIYRETELRFPLVDYRDLQSVSEHDLDLANRQAVFIAQETRDTASANLVYDAQGHFNAGDRRVVNLAPGVDAKDAVNFEQLAHAIRTANSDEPLDPIMGARPNRILSFNAFGQPVAVFPSNSSALDLEMRLANPETGGKLVWWRLAAAEAVGLSLEDTLATVVSVAFFGASPSRADNRLAIQNAINYARTHGLAVFFPPGIYRVDLTIWVPSGMLLYGLGGKGKQTAIVANDGHFTDMLYAGEHDEGVNHAEVGRLLLHRNGFPYTYNNIGRDISIKHINFDGNGTRAGFAPEMGAATDYRGSNIILRYVDGVTLHDVLSEWAPNDCAMVARCRRISVTDSEFSRNYLIGNAIGGTRNGITITGTLSGHGLSTPDFIEVSNVSSKDSEDLGVCIQFITDPGYPTEFSGTVNVSGITTYRSATYGFGIEISGYGGNQPSRQNINISNILSIEDSQRRNEAFSAVLISHRSRAVNLSNVVIRDSGGHGLMFSGTATINMVNVHVDGFNLGGFQNISGVRGYQVAPDTPQTCTLTNVTVLGGGGRTGDTLAVNITGYDTVVGANVITGPTSYKSISDSAAVFLSARVISWTNSHTANSATNGMRFLGYSDLTVVGSTVRNSGMGGGAAQSVGFYPGAGTGRHGRFIGCAAYDDQAVPTQTQGFLLGVSATDQMSITSCDGWGNKTAACSNLGMPNAYVHNNTFPYVGATLPFRIGGNGGWQSGVQHGVHREWYDTYGTPRVKGSAPTGPMDGFPLGMQVAVPASSTSSGAPGRWAVDDSAVYFYTGDGATHKWRKVATTSW